MPMLALGLPDTLPGSQVQRREQTRRAMTDVVMRLP